MVRAERSAGVILFHRSRDGEPAYLLLDYGKHWDYAKGHVNRGETDLVAALRELHEETGITRVKLVPDFARQITYFFRHRRRGLIRKQVVFFLASTRTQKVTLSDEHVDYAFLPYAPALDRLTYASARQVLREAHNRIGAAEPDETANHSS